MTNNNERKSFKVNRNQEQEEQYKAIFQGHLSGLQLMLMNNNNKARNLSKSIDDR